MVTLNPPRSRHTGVSFSCSGDGYGSIDEGLEALIMRTLSFSDNVQSPLRSVSFNGRGSEPNAMRKAFGSRRLVIKGSLSFNGRERDPFRLETEISTGDVATRPGPDGKPKSSSEPNEKKPTRLIPPKKRALEPQPVSPDSPQHEAAVKLQKVYKGFRTRRLLADCAVLVEQRWWKVLDFAMLKQSSVSFFDVGGQESAVSKWSRARTRAAKVGKGLSKDENAQKLALQHWLEAIDPRHRYGHNLHFYYDSWLRCESKQPFFYWLDVGDGKEVNIEDKCPRSKLQQQCIKYLGPKEREVYEVIVEDGKFMYKNTRQLLSTSNCSDDAKWIFVLSTTKTLYVGQKKKGTFQHSSFLAGGATSAAGRLVVENGVLKAVWPHSGHYRPTEENFQEFMNFLEDKNVDLSDVKKTPCEDDEGEGHLSRLGSCESELTLPQSGDLDKTEEMQINSVAGIENATSVVEAPNTDNSIRPLTDVKPVGMPAKRSFTARRSQMLQKQVVKKLDVHNLFGTPTSSNRSATEGSSISEHCIFRKDNLFAGEEQEVNEEAALIPPEQILQRINSKKGMKSYQLGKQLSFKWTTGAGPRIGCVRDYPSELQFRALEQVNLSPIGAGPSRFTSPRNLTALSPRLPEISATDEQKPLQSMYVR